MKRSGKKDVMSVNENRRFETVHDVLSKRRQMAENTKNAQEYLDNMQNARREYASAIHKIHTELAYAKNGLAAIDEKGMSDRIIEAIDKIAEIRNRQIAVTGEYSTQMVSFDSKRADYIREHGDNRDRFVIDKFDDIVKQKNAKFRDEISELDMQYREIEANLHKDANGKHYDPTDEEILQAKREQDKILEQKQVLMDEYTSFLQRTAVERDDVLNGWQDKDKISKNDTPVISEETKAKEEKLKDIFDTAEKESHSKWEKFKSLPVITQLAAGGAFIGRKIADKFDTSKSDLLAGYATMKERKQVRKAERALSDLDKLQGKEGDGSHLSRFKSALLRGSDETAKVSESEHVSNDAESETTVSEVTVTEQETPIETQVKEVESEPVEKEDIHTARVRKAGNQAVLQALDDTGLRRIINDYYWSDISETHDIITELNSSENVMTDVTKYVDRVKGMINHWPNETYRKAMIEKLDTAMMQTYAAKTESEKKVSRAEARIRDSEEFLRNLDQSGNPAMSDPEILTV